MTHLTEQQVLDEAVPAGSRQHAGHLGVCQDCRLRVAAMANLAAAGHVMAAESLVDVTVPAFDRVRSALPLRTPPLRIPPLRTPEPARRANLQDQVRLAGVLVLAQLRLLPAALVPVSVIGFAAAVLLAVSLPPGRLSVQVFGAVVALVVLTGALSTYSHRRDPRAEPLFSMPVSPATVFVCRLVGVLGIDLTLGVLCSVAVRLFGGSDSLADTLSSWFGQALLASGIALVFAVGRSPALGAVLSLGTWALGSASSMPATTVLPLRSVMSALWTTSPWVLVLAVALVVLSVLQMRMPRVAAQSP
ncbi:MAG TPA: hypothetical protein VGJ13_15390 [Pseudonocardiaceae bacterium]